MWEVFKENCNASVNFKIIIKCRKNDRMYETFKTGK
jgi:hypothetical protein